MTKAAPTISTPTESVETPETGDVVSEALEPAAAVDEVAISAEPVPDIAIDAAEGPVLSEVSSVAAQLAAVAALAAIAGLPAPATAPVSAPTGVNLPEVAAPEVPTPAAWSAQEPAVLTPVSAAPDKPAPISGLAIAGLGSALATPFVPFAPVVGVILSHIALSEIKKSGERGRTLAVAGLWANYALIAIGLTVPVFFVAVALFVGLLGVVSGV